MFSIGDKVVRKRNSTLLHEKELIYPIGYVGVVTRLYLNSIDVDGKGTSQKEDFDLYVEPAHIDWELPIRFKHTKEEVKILTRDASNKNGNVIAQFLDKKVKSYNESDFENIPEEPKEIFAYANVYPDGHYTVYRTEDQANRNALIHRIACVKLTGSYVAGQFDE